MASDIVEFYVRQEFDSFKQFEEKFNDWCMRNFHVVKIHDSHKLDNAVMQ